MLARIFEYAVIFHPKPKKVGEERITEKSELVVDVTRVIATDEKSVAMLAARQIPDNYVDKLDQVEIAIRPF